MAKPGRTTPADEPTELTQRVADAPRPHPVYPDFKDLERLPVVDVHLPETAAGGGTIRMRKFTTRVYLAIRRKTMTDVEMMELVAAAVVEFLPGLDVLDLGTSEIMDVLSAWIDSANEAAVPPR